MEVTTLTHVARKRIQDDRGPLRDGFIFILEGLDC